MPSIRMANYKFKTTELALVGLMTAITCILGPIAIVIPFSPVPFSLGLFAIILNCTLLYAPLSTLACMLYLLLGAAGLPVFSGFTGGLGVFLGPTGGYLLGYCFLPLCANLNFGFKRGARLTGIFCGLFLCYICGTCWLGFQVKTTFCQALLLGVVPYLPWDILKVVLAWQMGNQIRRRMKI